MKLYLYTESKDRVDWELCGRAFAGQASTKVDVPVINK